MKRKIRYDDIIDVFLTACAEADELTDKKEIADYIKERKKLVKDFMAKKVVK